MDEQTAAQPPAIGRPGEVPFFTGRPAVPAGTDAPTAPSPAAPAAGAAPSPFGAPPNQFGAPQNQFGTPQAQFGAPQNQFGTPQAQFGAPQNQFGSPQAQIGQAPVDPSWGPPPFAPRSSKRKLGTVSGIVTVALVLVVKLVVFGYFFANDSSPITLPASVAGMAQSTDAMQQSSLAEGMRREVNGHVYATSLYTDPTRDNIIVLVGARGHRSKQDVASTPGPYTKVGDVTCTTNVDGGPAASSQSGVTTVLCWRQKRTLTVLAVATGRSTAQMANASQAVAQAWDAN